MGKRLTKEEFLDKKNADLIREVKEVFEIKNQLEKLNMYLRPFYKEGLFCGFRTGHEESKKMGLTYGSLDLLVGMVEALKSGDLIVKENPIDKKECYSEPKCILYFRDSEGNWYDNEYNPIENPGAEKL